MFGFVIGTICLFLLIGVLRRRHRYGPWHGHHHGGHRGGHGPRAFLWRLLRRIDATPAQEKVFRDEADGLRETARGLKGELRASGHDLAAALREENLDRQKLESIYRKQDELLAALRQRITDSLSRIHSTLDARQRSELADLLERGDRASFC
jgi:Spy/CpxP family protein refolding chaperone